MFIQAHGLLDSDLGSTQPPNTETAIKTRRFFAAMLGSMVLSAGLIFMADSAGVGGKGKHHET